MSPEHLAQLREGNFITNKTLARKHFGYFESYSPDDSLLTDYTDEDYQPLKITAQFLQGLGMAHASQQHETMGDVDVYSRMYYPRPDLELMFSLGRTIDGNDMPAWIIVIGERFKAQTIAIVNYIHEVQNIFFYLTKTELHDTQGSAQPDPGLQ